MSRPSKSDRAGKLALLGLFLLMTPACQQKMSDQPYYRPGEESNFFDDRRAMRPLEVGVVARGQLLADDRLGTGLTPEVVNEWLKIQGAEPAAENEKVAFQAEDEKAEEPKADDGLMKPAPDAPSDVAKFVDAFPFEITEADLERGAERYSIFCVACHGPLGNGRGKIQERGYLQPTSFLDGNSRGFERWRVDAAMNPYAKGEAEKHVPVGYFFEVITKGYGGMPSYNSQIKPADRWRIIAYVRALQLSRDVELDKLPEDEQQAAREQLEK